VSSNYSQSPCLLRRHVRWRLLCLHILSKALYESYIIVISNVSFNSITV
jgi:hypothetical protein